MKNSLVEELKRIHTLTYGEKSVNESFMDNLIKTVGYEKNDDPKKADLVSGEVNDFFTTLENIKEPVTQQPYGSMTFQKNVESIQIALMLLGYDLPRFGVDGLFGKETANAVEKFKRDNNIGGNELSESEIVQLGSTSYSNVKYDRDGTHKDMVNMDLLNDIQRAAKNSNLTVTITTASSGHHSLKSNKNSRHKSNSAVDISIINGKNSGGSSNNKNGDPEFRKMGNQLVNELVKLGYVLNSESGNPKAVIWQSNLGGNHFNHVHVSNKGVKSNNTPSKLKPNKISKPQRNQTVLTPEVIRLMVNKLKQRGVTPEELKSKTDSVSLDGLSEKNVYAKILKLLNAPITEENLKFMYAWRQAEGKGGSNNPFNTTWELPNSTVMNNSGVRNYETVEDGINATIKTLKNKRYACIVNGLRGDIGSSNIAKCDSLKTWGTGDLVSKVLIGYERGAKPNIKNLS